ncbi:MAG: hypothetical protein IJQ81_16820, partial [Oscillibacter sp.]|nr:hypothetical protein [Oscillibacter sp.]
EELNRTVRENLHDVKSSLEHIGKESPRKVPASNAVTTPDADATSTSDAATTSAPDNAATDAPPAPSETNL